MWSRSSRRCTLRQWAARMRATVASKLRGCGVGGAQRLEGRSFGRNVHSRISSRSLSILISSSNWALSREAKIAWWYRRWQRESAGATASSCRPHAERGLAAPRGVVGALRGSLLWVEAVAGGPVEGVQAARGPGDMERAWLSWAGLPATELARRRASARGRLRRLASRRPKARSSCCSRLRRQSSSSEARCGSGSGLSRPSARPRKPRSRSKLTRPVSSLSSSSDSFSQKSSSSLALHSRPRLSRTQESRSRGTYIASSPSD
mmetsp:Transcript_56954/g.161712  ORF Transcript_56954/g.161712 Transcript_56954/m.161712 type:complete len:263 (+) Transcript_56954:356-1144(+)